MLLRGRIVSSVAALAAVSSAVLSVGCSTSATADQRAADINVACAPSQRAVIKQTMLSGTPQVNVLCVDAAAAVPAGYAVGGEDPFVRAAYTAPAATPAVYYPQEIVSAPAPLRPRVSRASSSAPVRGEITRKSSWQKRALIIGGSAGAGAGIGALVGGKKGALIGAAIGGGGATVLDQIKNR
jgi:hypothetical protein